MKTEKKVYRIVDVERESAELNSGPVIVTTETSKALLDENGNIIKVSNSARELVDYAFDDNADEVIHEEKLT